MLDAVDATGINFFWVAKDGAPLLMTVMGVVLCLSQLWYLLFLQLRDLQCIRKCYKDNLPDFAAFGQVRRHHVPLSRISFLQFYSIFAFSRILIDFPYLVFCILTHGEWAFINTNGHWGPGQVNISSGHWALGTVHNCCSAWQRVCRFIAALRGRLLYNTV